MAEGVLVVFHLPPGSPPGEHRAFRRQVYGEETSSWKGKYRYHRTGVLDGIPHIRLYWGVVMVRGEDGRQLIRWLREQGAEVATRQVILNRGDEARLRP